MRILLVFLVLLIATTSMAVPVDPDAADGVAARFYSGTSMYALDTSGQTWYHGNHASTWMLGAGDLPVPLSEILDWHPYFLVAIDGTIWRTSSLNPPPDITTWHIVDPLPTGVVSAETESLNDLKARFR